MSDILITVLTFAALLAFFAFLAWRVYLMDTKGGK